METGNDIISRYNRAEFDRLVMQHVFAEHLRKRSECAALDKAPDATIGNKEAL